MSNFRQSVEIMSPYSAPTEGRHMFGLLLDFNESTIEPSPKVRDALVDHAKHGKLQIYPHSYPELEKKIAIYLGNGIFPSKIRVTAGADGGNEAITYAFVEQGDPENPNNVIIPSPSFGMFYIPTAVQGAKVVKPKYDESLKFPFQEVMDSINKKTKLIFICTPNNPTGTQAERENIESILEKAYVHNSTVILDRVYSEFTGDSYVDLVNEFSNLFILRSFSKAFGIASERIGYVISRKRNIEKLNRVLAPYNVTQSGVVAASAALDDLEYMQNFAEEVMKESKPLLEGYLERQGISFYKGAANFLNIPSENYEGLYESLKDQDILVRKQRWDLKDIKGPLTGIRVSLGTLSQTYKFIMALDKIKNEI